jgi:5'-deoxynucleotidase
MKNITVTSRFYTYLTRLRWIKHWGVTRNAYEENVTGHNWEGKCQ